MKSSPNSNRSEAHLDEPMTVGMTGQEELREAATCKAPRPKFLNTIEPKCCNGPTYVASDGAELADDSSCSDARA